MWTLEGREFIPLTEDVWRNIKEGKLWGTWTGRARLVENSWWTWRWEGDKIILATRAGITTDRDYPLMENLGYNTQYEGHVILGFTPQNKNSEVKRT